MFGVMIRPPRRGRAPRGPPPPPRASVIGSIADAVQLHAVERRHGHPDISFGTLSLVIGAKRAKVGKSGTGAISGWTGAKRDHARRTPARRAARRVRARRGRPPVAARHPRRRALRLRRPLLRLHVLAARSASGVRRLAPASTSTGCTRCATPSSGPGTSPGSPRRGCPTSTARWSRSTPATTPRSTRPPPRSPAPRWWSTRPSTARWPTCLRWCAPTSTCGWCTSSGTRAGSRTRGPRRCPGRRPTAPTR